MPKITVGVNPLKSNKILTALYNFVMAQEVAGDNIKGTYGELLAENRIDVGKFGDQRWYYFTDALASYDFVMDSAEQLNLLSTNRPEQPVVQGIMIDQFRQLALTLDEYISAQAWGTEGAFSQFNSVMQGWMGDTRRIVDSTTFNTFIGTNETNIGKQQRTINAVEGQNDALTIAEDLANLLVELKDVSRDFNDNGQIRSLDEGDVAVIFNSKYWNKLKKVELPVVFHQEGLLDEFKKVILPSRYFGVKVGEGDDEYTIPKDPNTYRTLVEMDVQRNGKKVHLFPGDELLEGETGIEKNIYKEDDKIAYKVMHKKSVPYMSSFSVNTSFFNAKNLSTNYYMTFGRNTLEHLSGYPFITARYEG